MSLGRLKLDLELIESSERKTTPHGADSEDVGVLNSLAGIRLSSDRIVQCLHV